MEACFPFHGVSLVHFESSLCTSPFTITTSWRKKNQHTYTNTHHQTPTHTLHAPINRHARATIRTQLRAVLISDCFSRGLPRASSTKQSWDCRESLCLTPRTFFGGFQRNSLRLAHQASRTADGWGGECSIWVSPVCCLSLSLSGTSGC